MVPESAGAVVDPHPLMAEALVEGWPLVALELTIITHGRIPTTPP